MIIRSYSNIDIIQGIIGYGNVSEGITDWRITNTNSGIFNILNSSSIIRPSGGTSEIGEITGSTDRYMIFTAGSSTFTVPSGGIKCDILVVGGGGGGGGQNAGGGGAGGLVLIQNITLSGNFTINIGSGGSGGSGEGPGGPGINTTFTKSDNSIIITANGGGSGGGTYNIGGNGGSGGGGGFIYSNGTQTQKSQSQIGIIFPATINQFGEDGGHGGGGTSSYPGGGGGGAGGVGATSGANETGQNGGYGIDRVGNFIFKEKFISSVGDNGWFSGGGGSAGGYQNTNYAYGNGGSTLFGGGGNGDGVGRGINGINGTGGGGGGARLGAGGGSGGSGIVIIRYSTANISIIDNGNVGIGITPTTNSSKLEIGGNVNITGIYKKNNRNVVSDTSNYVLSTSNLLVNRIVNEVIFGSNYTSRINTELNTKINDTSNYVLSTSNLLANRVSSQWTSVNSGIYYTKANSAITSTPQPLLITNELGTIRTMVFTYTTETGGAGTGQTLYTINVPTNITCDILVVGGGGSGGIKAAGGGGAGGLIFRQNETLNGTYTIRVGNGGSAITVNNTGGLNGSSSSLGNIIALGGGGGGAYENAGKQAGSGGSGGGSFVPANVGYDIDANSLGNNGGIGKYNYWAAGGGTVPETSMYWAAGGGGGAGSKGEDAGGGTGSESRSLSYAGGGGNGLAELNGRDFKTYFNLPTDNSIGQYISAENKIYFAGGGGGGNDVWDDIARAKIPLGGKGGGGIGINNVITNNLINALANSGGGGGSWGSGGGAANQISGRGGSGIVIIRFVIPTGNVGIGTTNPISKLHVFDDTTNNTTLTIQNNYTEPVTIFPSTGYALTETIENNIYYRTLTFTYSLLKNYPIIPPIPGNPTNTTLLAWYRFNGDGLDYNTSATKYNLIANGVVGANPTYSSGTTTDSFFQGLRYINTGTGSLKNTSLSLASRAFSIAVWQRKKNSSIALFIAQSASVGGNISLHIGQREYNVYTIDYYGNGLNSASSYPEDINAWVHVVYVVLSNNNRRIYRNGVLIATDSNTTAFTGSGDLRIGVLYSDNTANQNIDFSDLRIYTTGLSATDVATLYGSYTPLLAWYRFDGDGLDYNPYSTKYNLIAGTGTAPTYPTELFQGRKFLSTVSGTIKNSTIALKQRALSVSVWIRNKTLAANQFFLSQCQSAATNLAVQFGHNGNCGYMLSVFNADLTAGMGTGTQTTYPGDLNIWVHLVYVIETNYNKKIYRNGVLIAFDTNTNAFSGTADLIVGATFTNSYVNADLSDLRIYTVGLSATDIATLYASYSNIVTSDNYSVNFANTSRVFVNGSSKTVNGIYGIYTGETNSSMLPLSNQSDIPQATTTSIGTSSVIVKYAYNQNILPAIISGSGITSTIVGNTDVCSIFTYTGTPATNTNTTYTFTTTEPYICDILIIGGGGAGGQWMGAGGGAGGVVYVVNQILPPGRYSVRVGRGGIGADGNAASWIYGADQDGIESSLMNSTGSSYISLTLGGISRELRGFGGGGGGTYNIPQNTTGRNGGSGGGTMETNDNGYILGTIGLATQPATLWNGASYVAGGSNGRQNTLTVNDIQGGGGGGAGAVAANYTNGNSGVSINITGKSQFYAAGGGAVQYINTSMSAGLGGSSIGGNGCIYIISNNTYGPAPRDFATSGTNGTGSGGGGGRFQTLGFAGSGGSGVVIIRYRKMTSASFELINVENNIINREPIIPGTTVVAIPGTLFKYILFPYTITTSGLTGQTQYTFTATEDINCEILVVAGGGGGGGSIGGGGGAGAVVHIPSGTLSAGSYTIRVGNGGIGSTGGASANGVLSSLSGSFGTITAEGGGGVTGGHDSGDGNIGGSGGGAAGPNSVLNYGGAAGTSSSLGGFTGFIYGNRGGNNTTARTGGIVNASGGGGAGSAAADTNPNLAAAGNGGAGILINITGNNNYYGGGGGGGGHGATGGSGGIGGGGDGVREDRVGYPGAPNTGGGGGGGGWYGYSGGSGGSGVVIIKYLITKNLTTNYKIGNYNGDFKIISSVSSSISSTQSSTFSSSDIDYMRITGNGASIYNPTGSPQWSTVSDRRIKENIEKASYDKCYNNINNLELYRFNYIKELNNINKDIKQLGYIAQEVENIFPKAVSSQSFNNNSLSIPNLLSIDISQINYSLYGTVKKLIELDKNKEARIKKMEYLLNIDTPPIITSNITVDIPEATTQSNIIYTANSNNIIFDTSNNLMFNTSNNMYIDISNNMNFDTSNNMYLDTSNNMNFDTSNNMNFDTSNNMYLDISNNMKFNISTTVRFYTPLTSNLTIETLDTTTSNLTIETLDTTTCNLTIETLDTTTETSNLTIEILDTTTATSNLTIETLDTTTSNLTIETLDTTTSNLTIEILDTETSNLTIEILDTTTETSNLTIEILDTATSNLIIEILDTATSNLTIEILDTATSNLTIDILDTTIATSNLTIEILDTATSNLIIDILDTTTASNISIE